jgi:hypothetical protein
MPLYSFRCFSPDHVEKKYPRLFEQYLSFSTVEKASRVSQYPCPCGAVAKRELVRDLVSVNVNGLTPIHPQDSKFGLGKELEFAFGKFKENPDGTVDHNSAPFRDSGEMNRFMRGANSLGPPKLNDKGNPIRRPDGSIVREGAKLFKYGKNATPSRVAPRRQRPNVPYAWVDEKSAGPGASGGISNFKPKR